MKSSHVAKKVKIGEKDEEELTLVDVTERHRADVMEISSLTFGGHDWIGGTFDYWVRNPNNMFRVVGFENKDKKLVALEVLRKDYGGIMKVEEGERVPEEEFRGIGAVEALRVYPTYRGKGVSHKIQAELIRVAKEMKIFKTLRYTTYNKNFASIQVATKSGFECVQIFPYVMVADDTNGSDTIFITYPNEVVNDFRAKLHSVLALHNAKKREVAINKLPSATEAFEEIKKLSTTIMLAYWKPIDVAENRAALEKLFSPSGNFVCYQSELSCSFGTVAKDHQGHIACLQVSPYKGVEADEDALFLDLLFHLKFWLQSDAKISSFWFTYDERYFNLLKKHNIAREDMQYEKLYELKLQ